MKPTVWTLTCVAGVFGFSGCDNFALNNITQAGEDGGPTLCATGGCGSVDAASSSSVAGTTSWSRATSASNARSRGVSSSIAATSAVGVACSTAPSSSAASSGDSQGSGSSSVFSPSSAPQASSSLPANMCAYGDTRCMANQWSTCAVVGLDSHLDWNTPQDCLYGWACNAAATRCKKVYTFDADTVTDGSTGLIWQRVVPPDSYLRYDASVYCSTLTLAGFTTWRLPISAELEGLIDPWVTTPPTIDQTAFPNTPASPFWTEGRALPSCGGMADVDFSIGGLHCHFNGYAFVDASLRVRCVRNP